MNKLSSTDRSALIRFASSLPKGDETRRAVLAGLAKVGMEFDTKEALAEYLSEHPGADKSKHSVKESEKKDKDPQKEDGSHSSFDKFKEGAKKALSSATKTIAKVIEDHPGKVGLGLAIAGAAMALHGHSLPTEMVHHAEIWLNHTNHAVNAGTAGARFVAERWADEATVRACLEMAMGGSLITAGAAVSGLADTIFSMLSGSKPKKAPSKEGSVVRWASEEKAQKLVGEFASKIRYTDKDTEKFEAHLNSDGSYNPAKFLDTLEKEYPKAKELLKAIREKLPAPTKKGSYGVV